MKKFFAIAAVALMALTANAQIYVGTGLGFSYDKADSEGAKANTEFSLNPEIGYNLTDQFAVGLDLDYTNSKVGDKDAVSKFGGNVYGRYNIAEVGSVKLFGELAVGYMGLGKDAGAETHIALRPGASVALSDKVSLQTRLNLFQYTMYNKDAGDFKKTQFGLINGSKIQLSLIYNL